MWLLIVALLLSLLVVVSALRYDPSLSTPECGIGYETLTDIFLNERPHYWFFEEVEDRP